MCQYSRFPVYNSSPRSPHPHRVEKLRQGDKSAPFATVGDGSAEEPDHEQRERPEEAHQGDFPCRVGHAENHPAYDQRLHPDTLPPEAVGQPQADEIPVLQRTQDASTPYQGQLRSRSSRPIAQDLLMRIRKGPWSAGPADRRARTFCGRKETSRSMVLFRGTWFEEWRRRKSPSRQHLIGGMKQ